MKLTCSFDGCTANAQWFGRMDFMPEPDGTPIPKASRLFPFCTPHYEFLARSSLEGIILSWQRTFNEQWDDVTKLQWQARRTENETGLRIRVFDAEGSYSINVERTSTGGFNFADAWTFLTGVNVGAQAIRRGR